MLFLAFFYSGFMAFYQIGQELHELHVAVQRQLLKLTRKRPVYLKIQAYILVAGTWRQVRAWRLQTGSFY